ncbi:MAG: DUF5915 domain-containing protein, partial [bacterium]|nr:DUF5915 domain-containing protein [bacterium]
EFRAKANFRRLGPRLGAAVKKVAGTLAELSGPEVATLVERGGIVLSGHHLTTEDVIISRHPRPGTVVASDGALSVALDTAVTEELVAEGRAREVVSRIQRARRNIGLEVSDRIRIDYHTDTEDLHAAIVQYRELIAGEVLATSLNARRDTRGTTVAIGNAELHFEIEVA